MGIYRFLRTHARAKTVPFVIKCMIFMIKNNFNNATIVTDAHHSARVLLLTSMIPVSGDESLNFTISVF